MWPLKVRAEQRFGSLALGNVAFGLPRFEWEVAVEEVIIVVERARALVVHGLDGDEPALVMAVAVSRAVAAKVMVSIEGQQKVRLATVMISILGAEVAEVIVVDGATMMTRTAAVVEHIVGQF